MKLFEMFKRKKGAAFMPYVCCGDPDAGFTVKLVKTLVQSGADAIELGIPFSDPIADGKAIQAASQRALAAGMTPKKALGVIARLRREGVGVPIIAMTYYNIAFCFGQEKFARALKAAGAQGLIVPDAPIGESGGLSAACRKAGLDLVQFATPNCSDARLGKIARKARGFLYAVAVLGITGARKKVGSPAIALVRRARRITRLPIAVGFGVSKPAHAKELALAGADGVIVGSGIVNGYSGFIRGGKINERAALSKIAAYAREMKSACLAKQL